MLVSIIMPSFNQAVFLQQSLESVLSQSWGSLELIVMDGGSNDGSVDILREYSKKDKRLFWRSEEDKGPADALNKAIRMCRGTLIGWLNSDDCYTKGAIERAVIAMKNNPNWMACYGYGEHIDENGCYLGEYPTLPSINSSDLSIPNSLEFQNGCFICQPTVFFKSVMPKLLGEVNTELKCAFDFDYWLRAFRHFHERIGFIPYLQAQSRLHRDCITMNFRRQVALEGMKVLYMNQGFAHSNWVYSYINELKINTTVSFDEIDRLLVEVKPYLEFQEWNELKINLMALKK